MSCCRNEFGAHIQRPSASLPSYALFVASWQKNEVWSWLRLNRTVMATDLDGFFYASRAAIPHLTLTKGSIIHVSSVSGIGGDWGMAAYNAAKGAVTNLTHAMVMDHGRDGIRVNAVCPSFTKTGMTDDMADDQGLVDKFNERFALEGPGKPEDVAAVIAFLASEDARFVSGVNLPVDGGMSASNGQPPQ